MASTQFFHQTAQHWRSHLLEDIQENYAPIPSIEEIGQMIDFFDQMAAPNPTGPADTWDILGYRMRQGSQNSMLSNVIDSVSLMGSQDPYLDRFIQWREKENALYASSPSAAEAVKTGNDGGFAGDVAQFAGQLTDPIVVLLVFLSALFIRFVRGHKENI
jgi:hypothetical protein